MLAEGLNPSSLAKAANATQSTVFRIVEGEAESPRDSTLLPLAKYFGLSVEDLRYGKIAGDNVSIGPQDRGIFQRPLLSCAQAREIMEAADVHAIESPESWVDTPSSAGQNSFWLRVDDDSMTAPAGLSIPEGMLILVDPDLKPASGSLVFARSGVHVTFKKLVMDAGRRYLKPLNPAYPVIEVGTDWRVIGVIREAKHVFQR